MKKRFMLAASVLLVVLVLGFFFVLPAQVEDRFNKVRAGGRLPISQTTQLLHHELFIADFHADSLLWDRNLLVRGRRGHVDLPRLEEGNVALQAFTVVTKVPRGQNIQQNTSTVDQITPLAMSEGWPRKTWTSLSERAHYQAAKLQKMADATPQHLVIIRTSRDLALFTSERNNESGTPVAAYLGLEGAHALEGDLRNLDKLFDAGFRTIGLSHFFDNEFAGSAHGAKKGGLTPLGRELVKRMEAKQMIVDLAHASPQTIAEVLAISTRPVMVSHTGVKGTCDNQRNLSDSELRAIAGKGGLIGIGYWQTAVCGTDARAIAKASRHAVLAAGIDHVALGSDFDGAVTVPFDTSEVIQVTQALLDAGFSEEQIKKIMGGNALQFLMKNLPPG